MIIKSKNSSTHSIDYNTINIRYEHEEPIDDYVCAEITEDGKLRYWNHILSKVFKSVKKAPKIELEYGYWEWSNWIDVLCGIIQDINKMNFIPRIIIHVYGNIEPPDIFLKYFTVTKINNVKIGYRDMIIKSSNFTSDWYIIQETLSSVDELLSKYNNTEKRDIPFKYDSEILLITNSRRYNFSDLAYWIFYHKNVLKFDNIVIVHNNNDDKDDQLALMQICKYFNVDYFYEPIGSQKLIFNKYQKLSEAKWMICIDEDEFIYLPDNITINDLLRNYKDEYKLTFDMINFYSDVMLRNKNNKTFLENFRYICLDDSNKNLIFQNETDSYALTMYKTFVNNSLFHYLINATNSLVDRTLFSVKNEHNNNIVTLIPDDKKVLRAFHKPEIGLIHNPFTMYNKEMIKSYNLTSKLYVKYSYEYEKPNVSLLNNPFIAHYKYRTLEEYANKVKYNKFMDVTSSYYDTNYKLDKFCNLYEHKTFFKVDKLYENYLSHVNEWNIIRHEINW